MINYKVPFYKNLSDDTHCFQACLKMILKYFFSEKDYSWEYLDKISAKIPGKWTWQMAALMWLNKMDIEVRNIELFDYERFTNKGEDYLLEFFGKEVAEQQIANSLIPQEIEITKSFIKEIKTDVRLPDINEIKTLLDEGFLVICNINSYALNNEAGYAGHSVIVKGYDTDNFFINDHGLPGVENRIVNLRLFEKAWAYPNDNMKNITAIRKRINKNL